MNLNQQWINKSNYIAEKILKEVEESIPLTYPIPIAQVVKLYVPFTQIYSTNNPDIIDSISACATRDVRSGWLIFLNASETLKRQRFSLAHELGHMTVITNTSSTVYCGKFNGWEEKVCDNFAGRILVPDKMLLQFCQENPKPYLMDVSDTFQVSPQVVQIRMRDLQLPYTTEIRSPF